MAAAVGALGIEREERGEVDLGEGRRKGEREGGKWERGVEAEASGRPYPLARADKVVRR